MAALIIFIVLAGAALRLWQIGNKSLWSDELFSAGIITSKYLVPLEGADIFRRTNIFNIQDIDTFWTVKAADQSPPLFEFIGKIFTSVVGANEISIRLPSALASIFLLLFLAQECWKENNTKNSTIFFFTLLPTAFSAILIEYAQEGRAYS
ncbi:MAG: hypothetical protein ACRERV_03185, partial [Methylococcales bacterium]